MAETPDEEMATREVEMATREVLERVEAAGFTVAWSSCTVCGRPREEHSARLLLCPPVPDAG